MSKLVSPETKFSAMGIGGKLSFFVKLLLFIVSFGFAFPTLLSD